MKKIKEILKVIGLLLTGCYFALMVEYGVDLTLAMGEELSLLLVTLSYKIKDITGIIKVKNNRQ